MQMLLRSITTQIQHGARPGQEEWISKTISIPRISSQETSALHSVRHLFILLYTLPNLNLIPPIQRDASTSIPDICPGNLIFPHDKLLSLPPKCTQKHVSDSWQAYGAQPSANPQTTLPNMRAENIIKTLVSSALLVGVSAEWSGVSRDDVQCSTCSQGKAVLLFDDGHLDGFCDEIVNMYRDEDWKDTISKALDAGVLIFQPDGEYSDRGPSDRDNCRTVVSSIIGGCSSCAVGRSAEVSVDGNIAGLLVVTGSCFCADPATCAQPCA